MVLLHKKMYHLVMEIGLFASFANKLIDEDKIICRNNSDVFANIKGNSDAIDVATVDLCLNVFLWTKFGKEKRNL